MKKLNTLLQDYKNWLLNEYDLKEYESDWKSFKELVQRLVDNDKIQSKYLTWWAKLIDSHTYVEYSKAEQLIMDLSIQDNPIKYLCSILKQ